MIGALGGILMILAMFALLILYSLYLRHRYRDGLLMTKEQWAHVQAVREGRA